MIDIVKLVEDSVVLEARKAAAIGMMRIEEDYDAIWGRGAFKAMSEGVVVICDEVPETVVRRD